MGSYALVAVLCLLLVFGCGTGMPDEDARADLGTATQEDSLFSFLQQVDGGELVEAFASLTTARYSQYVRTEQFDGDGYLFAFRERIVRVGPDDSSILAYDSAGSFNFGYLGRFASDGFEVSDPANLAENIVPEDPAYLSARSREIYTYATRSTTLPGYGEVTAVEIRAMEGEDVPIQRTYLYLEPNTRRIVAVRVQRRDAALWFREESDFFLSIRRTATDEWVPHRARIETWIRMPLRPVQRFRTVSTFFSFDDRPG